MAAGPGQIDWDLLLQRIFTPTPAFWSALGLTVSIAVFSQLLGILLGAISATMQRSRFKLLNFLAGAYIYVIRGTPVIVLVFFIYYGANMIFGIDLFPDELNLGFLIIPGAVLAGIVGLGIAEGAYMSEIIRTGINSVDLGQFESAAAIGMTKRTAMRRIIFPQAARVIIPPLGNQFNGMIKMTSLLAFIGIYELFFDAQITYSNTFKPVEVFTAVAIWYIIITTIWNVLQRIIEHRLARSDRDPAADRRAAKAAEKQTKEVIW